jgi:hypothetical protein
MATLKKTDSQKLDQIISMLGDVVDVFGKRFDKIEATMATKEQVLELQTQVNSIEGQLRETKINHRLGDLEVELFGKARG